MILVDTTPLVALCDRRDSLHRAAWRHLANLSRETFAVCDPALTEACFHLPHDGQRRRLRRLLEELSASVLTAGGEMSLWWTVFDWMEKYSDHEPDWADGYIAALCGRDRGTGAGRVGKRPDARVPAPTFPGSSRDRRGAPGRRS